MITSLHLGNFKAFGESQDIPVKPITLIFGANSAGKSSIIHSLALAHEAMRTGELDLFRTDLGGSSIDLGGFRQYIHKRQAGYRMIWGLTLSTSRFTGRLKELFQSVGNIALNITTGMPLDDQDQPLPGALPHVISYELESDGSTLLRMSRRSGNQMAVDLLPYKHPVLQQLIRALLSWSTTTSEISEKDLENLEKPIAEVISNLRGPIGSLFPVRPWTKKSTAFNTWDPCAPIRPATLLLPNMKTLTGMPVVAMPGTLSGEIRKSVIKSMYGSVTPEN